jgi:hypothetical protein
MEQQHFKKALDFFNLAYTIHEQVSDKIILAQSLNNMGNAHKELDISTRHCTISGKVCNWPNKIVISLPRWTITNRITSCFICRINQRSA